MFSATMQCWKHPVLTTQPSVSRTHLGHTEVSCGGRGISLLLGMEGGQFVLALEALQLGQGASAARTWEREQHTNHFYSHDKGYS